MLKEAMLYHMLEEQEVVCDLCHHRCQLKPKKFGICGVRQNREGKLYTHVFGEVIAAHVDPIEKKPLYHFLPGTSSFSIATIGCNFHCPFCQNWQISQSSQKDKQDDSGRHFSPEEIVAAAVDQGCRSISYTYTEPTIFFEYAYETAELASEKGLSNVFVTNGYMTPEALNTINPYLDACNVDLKSFRKEFYKKICRARLEPVLESIRYMKKLNIWVEVTTLVVPGQNDSEAELTKIARFIAEVDPDIPWHISRFHPDYKYMDSRPTPIQTLHQAFTIGKTEGLHHIYIGNVLAESENTVCPKCQKTIIRRRGFSIYDKKIDGPKCPFCNTEIAGVF
jgi:pyruvate formate lyase activating enzyme